MSKLHEFELNDDLHSSTYDLVLHALLNINELALRQDEI